MFRIILFTNTLLVIMANASRYELETEPQANVSNDGHNFTVPKADRVEEESSKSQGTLDLGHQLRRIWEAIERRKKMREAESIPDAVRAMINETGSTEKPHEPEMQMANKSSSNATSSPKWFTPYEGAKSIRILSDNGKCEDVLDDVSCNALKPLCKVLMDRAFRVCRKTCNMCANSTDYIGLEYQVQVPGASGRALLNQKNPDSSTFISICVDKSNSTLKEDSEYSIMIHDYAAIANGGFNCTDLGSGFNPFHAPHGAPSEEVKQIGDLGKVKFSQSIPQNWTGKHCTDQTEIGAYTIVNHLNLFNPLTNPDGRVFVLHDSSGKVLACGYIKRKAKNAKD